MTSPRNHYLLSSSRFQVDALRLRLEEKESFLNKKTKQLQDLTEEKGTLAGEIRDMKDMLEVKERKINVLQKKVSTGQCPSGWEWVSSALCMAEMFLSKLRSREPSLRNLG